jgi:hypothetical protein
MILVFENDTTYTLCLCEILASNQMHIFAGFFRTQNCFDKLATQREGGQQTVLNVYFKHVLCH